MSKNRFILTLLLLTATLQGKAQVTLKATAGVGNMEHLSTGVGISIANTHSISLLFGSNCFIKTNKFSSYLMQYDVQVNRWQVLNTTPRIGIKGGYAIYTNDYYRWKLLQVIPFVGLSYPLSSRLDLFTDGGVAISRELSEERVAFGEIGRYKKYLPEVKVGVTYHF